MSTEVWPETRRTRTLFRYVPYHYVGLLAASIDLGIVIAISVASAAAYNLVEFGDYGNLFPYFVSGLYASVIFIALSKMLGLYSTEALLSKEFQARGVFIAWCGLILFLTSVFFVFRTGANYSRAAIIGFSTFGMISSFAVRFLIRRNLSCALDTGILPGRRAVIIGDPEELTEVSARYLLATFGAKEVGRFELMPRSDRELSSVGIDIDVVDCAIRKAQTSNAEQILLAIRWSDSWRKDLICERLRILPLPALLLPDRSVRAVLAATDGRLCGLPAIEVQRAPLTRNDLLLKRLFDLAVASAGLILLSPLLLITSLVIKLDSSGPIIFRQRRRGFNGKEFSIYKFRTMNVLEDGPYIRQACKGDARVTGVGQLLRASSMDELPQLLNVIRGQMSIVGPRPHAIAHDDEYSTSIENYAFRQHVKPGITGWAQTHGFRGGTPNLSLMKKRIQLDLWYINNWSLWLDLRIIARTAIELLRPRNAY
jgi:Undecaprenyl-phosphate glucose phosphotransferase